MGLPDNMCNGLGCPVTEQGLATWFFNYDSY